MRVVFAALCGVVFFLLRSWFINPDGDRLPMKFMIDVPARGFHATHDEMWELYVHSRFWFYTHEFLGWSVDHSYQVLSSVAGAVFIFLLVTYWQRLLPQRWTWGFVGSIAGGYMQLFFGDIENYTLMTTIVMAYFLAALGVLEHRKAVIGPSLLLAVALTFHLEAGFLLPSLIFLFFERWRRGQRREVWLAIAGFMVVVGGTLVFFHVQGLPLGDLFARSHAFGDGGHFREMLPPLSVDYYARIARLSMRLVPAWILVVPLVAFRRLPLDATNVHLLIASGVMTAFVLCWKAQLGVDNDWNLYAMAAVPISLLVWRNVASMRELASWRWPLGVTIALFILPSYSWIIANHLK